MVQFWHTVSFHVLVIHDQVEFSDRFSLMNLPRFRRIDLHVKTMTTSLLHPVVCNNSYEFSSICDNLTEMI